MTNSINNDIPFVPENTIDPAAGLNISINVIDALLQCAVISVGDNDPPSEAVEGDRYIVGDTPTGEWSTAAGKLARYLDSAWDFYDAHYALWGRDIWVNYAGVWVLAGASTASVTGFAIVDMASDDYTMTDAEAVAPIKFLAGVVDGKTLTWPATAHDIMPTRQCVLIGYGVEEFYFVLEGDGPVVAPSGQLIVQLSLLPGLGIVLENTRYSNYIEITTTTQTIYKNDFGATFYYSNAAGCEVTIDPSCDTPGFLIEALQGGAGQVEFILDSSFPAAINNIDGHTKTEGQYACVKLQATAAAAFVLSGRTGA